MQELIEAPLSADELAVRYRALCADPCYANLPGKIEINVWGRMVMTPASYYHGVLQGRLCRRLAAALGGETAVETPIVTQAGLFVADVTWASVAFMSAHGGETPLAQAPELCIEVVSPTNTVPELREKIDAFLACGASEVWIAFPKSKRFEFHGPEGLKQGSQYTVDLTDIFS